MLNYDTERILKKNFPFSRSIFCFFNILLDFSNSHQSNFKDSNFFLPSSNLYWQIKLYKREEIFKKIYQFMNLIFKSMRYIVRFYFHTFFKILGLSHSTFSPAMPFTLHNMDAQGHAPIQPRIDRFSRSLSARAAFFRIASWSNTVNRPSYSISRCYRRLFPSSRRFFPFFSFFSFSSHSPMTVVCFPLFTFNYY